MQKFCWWVLSPWVNSWMIGGYMNKQHFNKNASKDSKLTVQFDPAEYMQYLEGMDVTDEQATEILRTLWDMMVQFVDFGFNLNTDADSAFNETVQSAIHLDSETAKTRNELDKIGKGTHNDR